MPTSSEPFYRSGAPAQATLAALGSCYQALPQQHSNLLAGKQGDAIRSRELARMQMHAARPLRIVACGVDPCFQ